MLDLSFLLYNAGRGVGWGCGFGINVETEAQSLSHLPNMRVGLESAESLALARSQRLETGKTQALF